MLSRTSWAIALMVVAIVLAAVTGWGISVAGLLVALLALLVFVPLRSLGPESRRLAWATGTRRWVWVVGAVAFALGVGAMHLLGDPVYHVDCPTRAYRRCRTAHHWATAIFLGGVFGGVVAASTYPVYRLVGRGHDSDAGFVRPGTVVVSGTVEPFEETLESPFTDTETVCHRYAVQERHNARLFDDDGSWHTVDVGEATVPFYVADESGRVLVDAEGADLTLNEMTAFGPVGDLLRESSETSEPATGSLSGDGTDGAASSESASETIEEQLVDSVHSSGRVYQVDSELLIERGSEQPTAVADWEAERSGVFPLVSRDRRYTEDLLRPGDRVTVAGEADTFAYGYPERTVIGGDGAPVKISAGESQHASMQATGAVWVGGAIAAVGVPLGFGLMLLTL